VGGTNGTTRNCGRRGERQTIGRRSLSGRQAGGLETLALDGGRPVRSTVMNARAVVFVSRHAPCIGRASRELRSNFERRNASLREASVRDRSARANRRAACVRPT
jgi:hypothetical protein